MANWESAPVVKPSGGNRWESAPVVKPEEYERAVLLPMETNTETGERRWAVPGLVQGVVDSVIDAAKLPGDVLRNEGGIAQPQIDPTTGRVEPISDEMLERGVNAAAVMAPGVEAPAVGVAPKVLAEGAKAATDFGIPLTKGQRSGALRQLTKEEALRQRDGPAQAIIRGFDDTQREKIADALDEMGSRFGSQGADMAEMVTTRLRDKTQFSKDRAAALYTIAFDGGLTINREAVEALPSMVKTTLDNGSVIIDPQLTPAASRAMQEIAEASNLAGALNPSGAATGGEVTGVSLQGIDQIRRRIVNLEGTNPTDARALSAVKRAFDGWLDDAVDKVLIDGDEQALAALKAARAESASYKSVTMPKGGDTVGAKVSRLLKDDTTAQEVGSWLYGAEIVSPSLDAPKVAARIRHLLGPGSAEWAAVRASAWDRVVKDLATGDPRSAAMVVKRVQNFVNGKGSSLARILYNGEERDLMLSLVRAIKRTITPKDATNPSRSGHVVANLMDGIFRLLAAGTGLGTGGPAGLVAGALAYPVGKKAMQTMAAKGAIKTDVPVKPSAPIVKGAPSAAARIGGMTKDGRDPEDPVLYRIEM